MQPGHAGDSAHRRWTAHLTPLLLAWLLAVVWGSVAQTQWNLQGLSGLGLDIAAAERARDVVARLYAAYAQDARLMPDDWQTRLPQRDPSRARVIADFIAGMSDRFAMQAVSKIYGERPLGLINV